MNEQTIQNLAQQVGVGLASAATVYEPAIKRMAIRELTAFADMLADKQYDQAKAAIHAEMTAEELAEEKEALADAAVMMADENSEKRRMAVAIVGAALKAALSAVLCAGLF